MIHHVIGTPEPSECGDFENEFFPEVNRQNFSELSPISRLKSSSQRSSTPRKEQVPDNPSMTTRSTQENEPSLMNTPYKRDSPNCSLFDDSEELISPPTSKEVRLTVSRPATPRRVDWQSAATGDGRLYYFQVGGQETQWECPEALRPRVFADGKEPSTIFQAALEGCPSFITEYLRSGGDLDICDQQGRSSLHYACAGGDVTVLKALLHTASINSPDLEGLYPLDIAARYGHAHAVRMLVDATAKRGHTNALHEAAAQGHIQCVRELLNGGRKKDLSTMLWKRDSKGRTAAARAAHHQHMHVAELIYQSMQSESNSVPEGLSDDEDAIRSKRAVGLLQVVKPFLIEFKNNILSLIGWTS